VPNTYGETETKIINNQNFKKVGTYVIGYFLINYNILSNYELADDLNKTYSYETSIVYYTILVGHIYRIRHTFHYVDLSLNIFIHH